MKNRRPKASLLFVLCVLLTSTLLLSPIFASSGQAHPFITGLPTTSPLLLPRKSGVFITGLPETSRLTLPTEELVGAKETISAAYIATAYRLDFPKSSSLTQKALTEELKSLVQNAAQNRINTLFFQVRPSSDAFYHSKIFPSSRYLVSKEGDPPPIDALKTLIDVAKDYGIRIYAWINPYRITSSGESPEMLSPNNPARLHPEYTFEKDGAYYYHPALSEVRELVCDGIAEIVKGYDIAGILFDDYFYPENMQDEDIAHYEAYRQGGGELSLGDFRRENVNTLIRESYQTVKTIDPDCFFGVAPRGIWQNISQDPLGSMTAGGSAYDSIYCDALAWVREKTVDFLAPQLYWSYHEKNAPFLTLLLWWQKALENSGVALLPSLAAYRLSQSELDAQIFYLSFLENCQGYALYRISYLN